MDFHVMEIETSRTWIKKKMFFNYKNKNREREGENKKMAPQY